jgi:parvulin-like peptidyl-prolyl isomerase
MTAWLDTLLFGIYPYICLAVFFIGSWVRFDRDQYTWKSDSSQLLRTGSLRWGSNLFHIGVLFLFFGHTVGMLTPHFMYEAFISAGNKQVMAMVSGGIAGHFDAHARRYAQGERLHLRHILFAVTPGVDVTLLRQRAESQLIALRASDSAAFVEAASTLSNCPSGAQGGQLGWTTAAECAPEFARDVFGRTEIGVLPQLVHSRFGLHIVAIEAREPGTMPAFETVREAVAQQMRQQLQLSSLRQYLQTLVAEARVEGIALQAAESPLVQ